MSRVLFGLLFALSLLIFGLFGVLLDRSVVLHTDGVEDEVDDGVGQNRDDEANNRIKNGVLRVGDFFTIATGKDVAETAVNQHDDRDYTDDIEDGVGDLGEDAVNADEFSGHTISTSSGSTLLDGESHSFASTEGCGRANGRGDL